MKVYKKNSEMLPVSQKRQKWSFSVCGEEKFRFIKAWGKLLR